LICNYTVSLPSSDCDTDIDTMNSLDRRGQRLLLSIAYVGFSLPRRSRGLWCEDPARQQPRSSLATQIPFRAFLVYHILLQATLDDFRHVS
jgi:hypothetical protein